jgi:hypothetical protein
MKLFARADLARGPSFLSPLLSVLALGSIAGCTDAGLEGSHETQRYPIVGGHLSSPEDDAIVAVRGGGSGCTGTLIAPTVVLTALHCVTDFNQQALFSCRPDGTLTPGSTNGHLGPPLDPESVSVQWGINLSDSNSVGVKAIYSTGSTEVCHDDLAVVVLKSAPPVGDVPLVSLRFGPTRKGELTRIVGYGDVEQTQTERGRQERTGLVIKGVGGPDAETPGDRGVYPRTAQVEEGPCHGDSGGPLFSEETGAEIGVYSILHTSTCTGPGVRNTYTLIAPWEALIREALTSEGYEPLVEPEPTGAGGGAGATGEGGEPGVAGEAGAPTLPGSGGSSAAGGGGGRAAGGSGNSSGTTGEGAAPADPSEGSGSGSRRDGSCTCRAAGTDERAPWMSVPSLVGLAAWTAARRRRRAAR